MKDGCHVKHIIMVLLLLYYLYRKEDVYTIVILVARRSLDKWWGVATETIK